MQGSRPATDNGRHSTAGRTNVLLLVVVSAGLLAVAFAMGWFPRARKDREVRAATRELSLPTVTVVSPAPAKTGAAMLLPAEIRPWTDASIVARASGYVKRWHVELGATVEAGALLAELETPELNEELATQRAQLRQAEAAAALADSTAARWREMRREALVSQQETDEKLADARLKAAMVESAQAGVHRLEELLKFARITAPFAGVVTARRLDVGQLVTAGSSVELYRLAQVDVLRVFVRVPQAAASAMVPGLEAEVLLDGKGTQALPAKVVRTAGAMDVASRTLLTELELPNPEHRVLPGGFAQVRFTGFARDVPLAVPANTLLFRTEGPTVARLTTDNRVELRKVSLGRDLGAFVEITAGVETTDRLVLNPPDSITAGVEVRVVSGEQKP
jgi:membrane fusion protein, multidrug efflux system